MRNAHKMLAAVATLAATMYLAGCASIAPGDVGIEVSRAGSNRGVQDVALKTGWVFYNPMLTDVIEYPTFTQTVKWTKSADEGKAADESITFTTQDSLVVNADISVSYQLKYDQVPKFYVQFRQEKIEGFTDGFMRNVVRDTFNEIAGQYTVEQIMGDNGPILKRVREQVQSLLSPYGVEVTQLGFIGAPRPPQSVTNAINDKVSAQQIALQKQNEVAQAEAEAKKQIAIAQGQAEANRLLTQSLNPSLLEWKKMDKWDGHLPHVQAGGGLMIGVTEK